MKYSRKKEIILNFLKSVYTHPTAETVYNEIRKEYPNISLGTVYRNLDKLSKNGDIKRLTFVDNKDRFDANVDKHYHAVCKKCGEVYDVFVDYFKDIDRVVEKDTDCNVLSHDISFNIICSKCKN